MLVRRRRHDHAYGSSALQEYSVTCDVYRVDKETDKAWKLLVGYPIDKLIWLPKSKCTLSFDKQSIKLPDWIVNKKQMDNLCLNCRSVQRFER